LPFQHHGFRARHHAFRDILFDIVARQTETPAQGGVDILDWNRPRQFCAFDLRPEVIEINDRTILRPAEGRRFGKPPAQFSRQLGRKRLRPDALSDRLARRATALRLIRFSQKRLVHTGENTMIENVSPLLPSSMTD
jgi:hypothetical protein